MPVYQSTDNVLSGVPLGGIGAGKMEILPSGVLNAFTFQNNWSRPLSGDAAYPGVLGYHLGLSVETGDESARTKKSFLLQTIPVGDIPTVSKIRYEGVFPTARLFYEEPNLGLDVSLEVFSSWIPSDVKDSSLPSVHFTLRVKNKKRIPADVGFIFIGRNTSGRWCVGRKNRVTDETKALHLDFSNEDPSTRDARQGTWRFSFLKKGWTFSFMEYWNAVTKNFSFDCNTISLLGWEAFVKNGKLPDSKEHFVARGENYELCGAVAARTPLKPGEEKVLQFSSSAYFPKHPLGHRYQKWFRNPAQLSAYVLSKRNRLEEKTKALQSKVFSLPFPDWFNDALLSSLAPFFASTWYVRDGRFAFYEAPVICPLMGTLDVGFYGSIPLSYFFPELEKSQILQFAKVQRNDGYMPHDLGKNRLDLPSDGTTFYRWKDLNPKFILMAFRDVLWSGDRDFLKALYPHVKKALRWCLANQNESGLPCHEGADHTFDLWEFKGTHAYTAGIFLAALLACEKMGHWMEDPAFSKSCRGLFLKGRASFERELWNGSYFGSTCALSQLNGQWYASLLGLGTIADRGKIKKAIASILTKNTAHSDFGMVNSVFANGRLDDSNAHTLNVWLGMNYAFASLGLSEGFPLKDLLKPLARMWDNVKSLQKSPWNQPDMIDSKTGRYLFGDFYYRNMAIWSIPIGCAKTNRKIATILRSLRGLGSHP